MYRDGNHLVRYSMHKSQSLGLVNCTQNDIDFLLTMHLYTDPFLALQGCYYIFYLKIKLLLCMFERIYVIIKILHKKIVF